MQINLFDYNEPSKCAFLSITFHFYQLVLC